MTEWFLRPRAPLLLLLLAFLIGTMHTLILLPLDLISGSGPFWDYPRGTVPGSLPDYAEVYDGYLHFQRDGWHWPLLRVANINPPAGTNIIWLDGLPIVCLAGKIIYSLTGVAVNLLGAWQFVCFAGTGVAVSLALIAFGHKGLLTNVAGAAIAVALPFHLFEWGHIPLCAQFLLPLALSLYGFTVFRGYRRSMAGFWLALLIVSVLTNAYLFVMTGGIWAASLLQRSLHREHPVRVGAEALATILLVVGVMFVTGMTEAGSRSASASGFGAFSLNLLGPFIPQRSGIITPLQDYYVGTSLQTFGYVGFGVILLTVASLLRSAGWQVAIRAHAALLALLLGCCLFALSNRVTFGSHVVLQVPLPDVVVAKLGVLRASGRFIWPVAYALLVLSVATVASRYRPPVAVALLLAACLLQWADVGPIRSAIARTARFPAPAAIDRPQANLLAKDAERLMLFPTYGCLPSVAEPTPESIAKIRWTAQAIMEFHLIAARRDIPINSVNSGRPNTDCMAEDVERHQPLQAGALYVYFNGEPPAPAQLPASRRSDVCRSLGQVIVCKP